MNTCNSINSIALGKILKKYSLTSSNKQQIILLAQRKNATWSALHRLARKIEFKNSAEYKKIIKLMGEQKEML